MDTRVGTLRRALAAHRVVRVDVGRVEAAGGGGGELFLIMCSLGPDASVIHRLAGARTRALGHLAYVEPMIRELIAPSFPRVRVRVDGCVIVDGRTGMLVVANSRRYALGIDPAARASMSDGVLDVVFLPCRGRRAALAWLVWSRLGRHTGHERLVYEQGREVQIEGLDGEVLYQVDGEAGGAGPGRGVAGLVVSVTPACLPVLVP